ncbi:MAG: hypothetical protein HY234_02055 [Acidobacteria bacterium]|nr:hypothetical protein [Acidobacteriota bacterium]MBI3661823.1 hypothetical protein [Acidobacteriota bacterium]
MRAPTDRCAPAPGFSVLELLITVAIILTLVALATPHFLAAQRSAYDTSAAAFLRTLHSAEETYRVSSKQYTSQFSGLGLFGNNRRARLGDGPLAPVAMILIAPVPRILALQAAASSPGGCTDAAPGTCDVLISNGYIFTLTSTSIERWSCVAEPVMDRTTSRFYYTDNTGVIRAARGRYADENSPPLP